MIVSLTGFMGCGKSSVGKLACKLANARFVDLDDYIEDWQGRSIKEIFKTEGESGFRKMETEALRTLFCESGDTRKSRADASGKISGSLTGRLEDRRTILSLGGGTLTTPEAAQIIRDNTYCIYLKAGIDVLVDNLYKYPGERPMLGDARSDRNELYHKVEDLMKRRAAIYESTAHQIIEIKSEYDYCTVSETVASLLENFNITD